MQVLGQHVETGDIIMFPGRMRGEGSAWRVVARVVGLKAYASDGRTRVLINDCHVGVAERGGPGWEEATAQNPPPKSLPT